MRATLTPGWNGLDAVDPRAADMKPSLLFALTELYVQKGSHTAEEERQFVELAVRLIDAVDAATCAAAARSLANYAGAPPEILRRLADRRVESTDSRTEARQPGSASALLPATGPENYADAVALTQHFFAASPQERAALLAKLDTGGLHDSAASFSADKQTIAVLEASALAGRPGDFVRELERALGLARPLVEAVVNDRSGEPLVVAAKALVVPIDVLQRILLFVNPAIGHSVRRVFGLSVLFNQISLRAAQRLVACWRTSGEPKSARSHSSVPDIAQPTARPASKDRPVTPARPIAAARTSNRRVVNERSDPGSGVLSVPRSR